MLSKSKYLLLTILISELLYFLIVYGQIFIEQKKETDEFSEKIIILNEEIKTLKQMKIESLKPSVTDIKIIEKDFLNKQFLEGINIKKVEVVDKISKKGISNKFFTVKLFPDIKDKVLIKKLAILLFLNPEVYKLSSINYDFIEIILEKTYG